MKDNKPLLSIGMIVKNEERCLEKCLKALQPLRDKISCEIVIADTGSTDKTREIASKYADILFDFEWIDDFSAARNAVMDRCSGKWYLSIDADEYMDILAVDEIVSFLKFKHSDKIQGAFITIKNYIDPDDLSKTNIFYAFRLVRLVPQVRFEGIIHESFESEIFQEKYYLKKAVFWHDGYLKDVGNVSNKKNKRNIELLKKSLEENPNKLFNVFQLVEACYEKEDLYKYTCMMLDLIEKNVEYADTLAPVAYHHAVRAAWIFGFPEFNKWFDICFKEYPDSIHTRVDINYLAVKYNIKKEDYKSVIKYANDYLIAFEKIQDDKSNFSLRLSSLSNGDKSSKESIIIDMAMAYYKLCEYDKVKDIIKKYNYESIGILTCKQWLDVILYSWQDIDYSDDFIRLGKIFYENPIDEKDKLLKEKKDILDLVINNQFNLKDKEKTPIYPLIANLGNCDYAYCAKIMLSEDEIDIFTFSSNISYWSDLPECVFNKIMKLNMSLPISFYSQPVDDMQDMAGKYVVSLDKDKSVQIVLNWLNSVKKQTYPKDIVWRYYLITAAIRVAEWEDKEYTSQLLDIYLALTSEFINWYYNPEIICEQTIDVLPSMHAFAWFIFKYSEEKKNNNLKACIYWLKKSIKIAPVMKSMVKYLLKNVEEEMNNIENQIPQECNQELLNLAKKVKNILSSYPENDPAVLAIKQSEVYKQVAHLIEEPESKFKM